MRPVGRAGELREAIDGEGVVGLDPGVRSEAIHLAIAEVRQRRDRVDRCTSGPGQRSVKRSPEAFSEQLKACFPEGLTDTLLAGSAFRSTTSGPSVSMT